MDTPMLMVRVGAGVEVGVQMGLAEPGLGLAWARDMVRVVCQRHRLLLLVVMVPATQMLVVMVTVVAAVTTEMEVVPELALDRPAATTLLEALQMQEEAAMVVAQLEVSLKDQALELDLVLGLAPLRPVALALMAKAMPQEWVVAWVAALVKAKMEELAMVEAVGPDLVVEDTTKLPFVEQDRTWTSTCILISFILLVLRIEGHGVCTEGTILSIGGGSYSISWISI
ncbi:hypothetical protein VPH35_101634 [Triticum aestivum]